jgi:biopolymer transport protein ExbB
VTLLQMFQDGGIFMWPLLACSILGLAVIFVKFVTLHMARVKTERLLERVRDLVQAGRVNDAIELCSHTRGPVAAILLTGLHLFEEGGSERAEQAIVHAGRIEMAFLEKGMVVLATVSNVAPLIGFLGTVAGMIIAFGAIEAAGEVEAQLVAGGIKVALITTAAGLIIAIPVNVAHNYFVQMVDGLIVDMRRGVQAVQDMLAGSVIRVGGRQRPTALESMEAHYTAGEEE